MNHKKSIAYDIKQQLYPLSKLALPLAMTGIMQSAVFYFETVFLSRLGADTLAVAALIGWLCNTLAVVSLGILSSINILVARKRGAGDQASIILLTRDGLLLAIMLTLPAFLLFWHMPSIFHLFGESTSLKHLATPYLHALAWGILPELVMFSILELMMGLGDTRIIMLFSGLSVILSIFLSYTLIFGKFGLPNLHIAGAGFGVTFSYWVTATVLIIYVLTNKKYTPYFHSIFNNEKPHFMWELIKIGLPIGTAYSSETAFFFVITLIMGSMSTLLLSANQVAFQYMVVFICMVYGLSQAITIRMSNLLGGNHRIEAKHTGYVGILIACIFMGIIAACYLLFPLILISLDFDIHDEKNVKLIHHIKEFLALCALFQIVDGINLALWGILRALKDTRFLLLISILTFWFIALPVGYFLAIHLHWGGKGLWWGMILGISISIVILFRRFVTAQALRENSISH